MRCPELGGFALLVINPILLMSIYVCIWMNTSMYCMYVLYVCMYVCKYVCMYVCMYSVKPFRAVARSRVLCWFVSSIADFTGGGLLCAILDAIAVDNASCIVVNNAV